MHHIIVLLAYSSYIYVLILSFNYINICLCPYTGANSEETARCKINNPLLEAVFQQNMCSIPDVIPHEDILQKKNRILKQKLQEMNQILTAVGEENKIIQRNLEFANAAIEDHVLINKKLSLKLKMCEQKRSGNGNTALEIFGKYAGEELQGVTGNKGICSDLEEENRLLKESLLQYRKTEPESRPHRIIIINYFIYL